MYFIGSGPLLYHAVDFALGQGHRVDRVCCAPKDGSGRRLAKRGVKMLLTTSPNDDLLPLLAGRRDVVVFSVNNACLLSESLLACGPRFFNIHNGLVQSYRGLAEICIVAALCHGESRYGATLHELLPRQNVDSGPVVAQLEVPIGPDDGFAEVLRQSMTTCQKLFEWQLEDILQHRISPAPVQIKGQAYSYAKLPALLANCRDPRRLSLAARMGPYAGFFPRLHAALACANQSLLKNSFQASDHS
jgi:methionyl-tRNA formyltransferase